MLRAFGCSSTYGTSCKNPIDSWPLLLSNMFKQIVKIMDCPGQVMITFLK